MTESVGRRLEQYTIKRPQEVLIVTAEIAGEEDQIAIFKGFSSSLMRSTPSDPDEPVLSENAKIVQIDRVASPYNPNSPQYLQQGLIWEMMQQLLSEVGLWNSGQWTVASEQWTVTRYSVEIELSAAWQK